MFSRKRTEKEQKMERIQPFINQLLKLSDSFESFDKLSVNTSDPRMEENDNSKYVFKICSKYSFWKGRWVDHVYVSISPDPEYKRIDKIILDLSEEDIINLEMLLLSWI
jgi:hypothetical protein